MDVIVETKGKRACSISGEERVIRVEATKTKIVFLRRSNTSQGSMFIIREKTEDAFTDLQKEKKEGLRKGIWVSMRPGLDNRGKESRLRWQNRRIGGKKNGRA